ncbi:MAG TPA: L-threonylcarbamoyladenylate synthase [Thermomicrobiales bacterium]|nr:L-threonylcarbamoyladenylate synthase [Thermomicrobiales bacterium]
MTILRLEEPRALERTIEILRRGGLAAFPTDTVYGIGASLAFPEALDRIYDSKLRDRDRVLPVLIASPADLLGVATKMDDDLMRLASRYWPGPLTVAVPAKPHLPSQVVAADGTVGVRVPDHSVALVLAKHCGGALAVTSANVSGQPPARRAGDLPPELVDRLDMVLDGGIARGGQPSTVIGREGDTITIIREGAVAAADIEAAWNQILTTTRY